MSEQVQINPSLRVGRKVSHTPFPSREELMKRNSFPVPVTRGTDETQQFPRAGQEQVS